MRILSKAECHDWLNNYGFDYSDNPGRNSHVFARHGYPRVFPAHKSSPGWLNLILSYRLSRWVKAKNVLVWISGWSLSRPDETKAFMAFRHAIGDSRLLIDAPGHLFDTKLTEDANLLHQTIFYLIAFNWTGFILQDTKASSIWLADEVIEINTTDVSSDRIILKLIRKMDLRFEGFDIYDENGRPVAWLNDKDQSNSG